MIPQLCGKLRFEKVRISEREREGWRMEVGRKERSYAKQVSYKY
jgi:hypothetical protein